MAVVGAVFSPFWLFQGLERMRAMVIITVSGRLCGVLAVFALVRSPSDYHAALAIQATTGAVIGLTCLLFALTVLKVSWRLPSFRDIRDRLAEGRHLFASTAAVSLYTNTNVFALGLIAGPTVAGYYSAAYKLIQAVLRMVTPFTQSLYPHINAIAARSREEALQFIRLSLRRIALGAAFLSLAVFLSAEPVVMLLFGKDFEQTVAVLRWMSLLPFVIAVATVLGEHTMLTFGLQREFSRILLKAGVVNVFLVVPISYWLGAVGAGIASLTIEIFIALARTAVLQKGGYEVWSLKRSYA
jgi:O-antigen/teichoic acid export membrane protein